MVLFFLIYFLQMTSFFVEASTEQTTVIQNFLDDFCRASGQKVNNEKTCIFFLKRVSNSLAKTICNMLGFIKTLDLGKYLGAQVLHGRVDRYTFKSTIEKIKSKLSGWKSRNLSLAGRVTLANLVLHAMPIYPMLIAKFSLLTCQEIDKVIRDFVWGSKEGDCHMHLVN